MKTRKIILIMLIMLLVGITNVYAAGAKIIVGAEGTGEEAKAGETKTIAIKIQTEAEAVGMISGKIRAEGNITIEEVAGKNGWSLTYNDQEGETKGTFNLLKAAGAKAEEIMEIKYKAGEEGTGKIILETINATDINYEMEQLTDIIKEITVKAGGEEPPAPTEKELVGIEITKEPNKTVYTEGERFDKTGMVIKAQYSDGTEKEVTDYTYSPEGKLGEDDKKIIISYTENGITKTDEIEITVKEEASQGDEPGKDKPQPDKDGTEADKDIPNTGVENIIIPAIIIAIIGIAGYVGYRKNNI